MIPAQFKVPDRVVPVYALFWNDDGTKREPTTPPIPPKTDTENAEEAKNQEKNQQDYYQAQ